MISYSIHIVDDEESIREGLSHGLRSGYRVRTFPARSFSEVATMASAGRPATAGPAARTVE